MISSRQEQYVQHTITKCRHKMGAPSFYGSEFDLRKLLKKIQQRCSQITCGERGTETNCESPGFATATCPCSSSKRVELLDYRARYPQEVTAGRGHANSTT